MDVNLFIPINLRVANVLADGYTVTWELTAAAATAVLTEAGPYPALSIYGRDAITSNVSILGVVSAASVSFAFAVPSGISEVYLTATLGSTETAASSSVFLLSTNIMPEGSLNAIARDENGIARALAVTEDGVVKVTGVTVNNYGGDASAANQVSALAKADTLITSSNAIKAAVDINTSALSGVGLNAATVAALQIVAVNNIPGDFPDVGTTTAVNALSTLTAKETTLGVIANNTNNALKSTDLALSAGVLDVAQTNLPGDYPDLAVLTELQLQKALLTSVDAYTQANNTELIAGNNVAVANRDFNNASTTALGFIETNTTESLVKQSLTALNTANTVTAVTTNGTKIDDLALVNAELLKTADLALTSGVLSVTETTPVTNFPDTAAHVLLAAIDASVQAINSNHEVTFGESLPAGTNNIGMVTATNAILAPNAATESSLAAAVSMLNTGNVNTSNLRLIAANIATKLDDVLLALADNDQVIICDEVLTVSTSMNFRPEAVISPTLLSSFGSYVVQVFSYATPGVISFFKESAIDSNTYYHSLPEYKNMSLFVNAIIERDMTLVKNIMVRISSPGVFRVRITGIK